MSLHSIWGPSQGKRIINCLGSTLAIKDLPDEDSSYALAGTSAHKVAEILHAGGAIGAQVQVKKVDGSMHTEQVTPQMLDAVKDFLDYCDELPGDDFAEMRVAYEQYAKGGFGTLDRARGGRRTHIIDFKFGEGVQIWADRNEQLMLYALGFYLMFGWMYEIEDFELHIVQPRLDHIDRWVISLEDLLKWADEVWKPAVQIASLPGAPFTAGEWCQFCKLRRTCKTRARAVFEALTAENEDLDRAMASPIRAINTLSNEQIAKALKVKKIATSWFSDLEDHALSQLGKGIPVGDYKVVEGRSNRAWKNEDLAVDTLLRFGVPKSDVFIRKVISPAKLEELMGKSWVKDLLSQMIDKPKGSPVLAPGSDKRPPIKHDALDEFKKYPNENEVV